jgi:hypothetical protein
MIILGGLRCGAVMRSDAMRGQEMTLEGMPTETRCGRGRGNDHLKMGTDRHAGRSYSFI